MIIANIIAFIVLVIGGLNWGLIGIFGFNLVTTIVGLTIGATIVYILVLAATVWLIISALMNRGRIYLSSNNEDNK